MGANSQAGQIGFGVQSVKGTAVARTRFARIRSGSLGGDRSLMIPDPEIGGNRDIQTAYMGPASFSGDIEFYPRMEMIALLLRGAFGVVSSATVPGPPLIGTHTITPGQDIPWLTVEERLGASLETFRYTDAKVNTLRLEAEANGYLMGSANILAIKGESDITETVAPVFDETPLVTGQSVTFSFGGNDLKAKSFSLELNNNIENDDFRLGSTYMADAVPKRRELTMTASYRPDDAVLWKQAMWGGETFSEAQAGPAYRGAVSITIETFETIGNVVAGTPFSLTFTIPNAVIAPFKITPSGDDVIGTDIELTAIRPAVGTPLVTGVVVNGIATAT